jgi:hypothetical protein
MNEGPVERGLQIISRGGCRVAKRQGRLGAPRPASNQ